MTKSNVALDRAVSEDIEAKLSKRNALSVMICSVLVASGASYIVCIRTSNMLATSLTWLAVAGLGMFFGLRWWLRSARQDGIPSPERIPAIITVAVAYVATIVLGTAANYATYSFTGSRVLETAVSLLTSFPVVAFFVWKGNRLQDPPKAQDSPTLRGSFYTQIALTIILFFNLAMWLITIHLDDGVSTLHNLTIAAFIVLAPILPINAYFVRKRYLQARELETAVPA